MDGNMDMLTLILSVISIFGVAGTFYFGIQSNKLLKSKNRYSWTDIYKACEVLGIYMKRRIKPDLILCFSGPSGIVTNLIVESTNYFIPVYTIILEKKERGQEISLDLTTVQTSRWKLHFPNNLSNMINKKICIIDDAVISGDSLNSVKESLIQLGFKKDNIRTCSIVCTMVAKLANKSPDKYVYLTDQTSFFMPWGKGY